MSKDAPPFLLNKYNIMTDKICEYCGNKINPKFSDREIHKLCEKLREFSNGRSLTENNGYHMCWVPPEKQDLWPNLSVNSRGYVPVHQVIARLILNRDLNAQDSDDPEIVDHIHGAKSKMWIAPRNLRVMKLDQHVHSHKFENGIERQYSDVNRLI